MEALYKDGLRSTSGRLLPKGRKKGQKSVSPGHVNKDGLRSTSVRLLQKERPEGAKSVSPGHVNKDGLKGQNLSAQGIALGIHQAQPTPYRGKSILQSRFFCPYRAHLRSTLQPRAMPWADSCCPFGAFFIT